VLSLTVLYSRQGFITLADHQIALAKRQKMKTLLLYADLNNLKEINDTFGLKEGENALLDIATILKTTYRKSDIIARLGEDKFVVYPVGTTDTGTHATIVADRFQKNLDTHSRGSKMNYELSASIHISSIDNNSAHSFDEILL
jgi:diguanylate cyclase (GGDEF)-like protein